MKTNQKHIKKKKLKFIVKKVFIELFLNNILTSYAMLFKQIHRFNSK